MLSELASAELQGKFAGRSRNIPIVFMTASGDTIIGLNSTKHGTIDCLVRPFTAENLFAAVKQALLVDARTLAVPGS